MRGNLRAWALGLGVLAAGGCGRPAPHEILWGDLHTHSYDHCNPGGGDSTCHDTPVIRGGNRLTATPDRVAAYAKEVTQLDFYAVTNHLAVHMTPEFADSWKDELQAGRDAQGVVVFPGYEWTSQSGHLSVIFRDEASALPPSEVVPIAAPDADPLALWRLLREKGLDSGTVLTIPHHTARRVNNSETDWTRHSADDERRADHAEFSRLTELYSCHGCSEGFPPDAAFLRPHPLVEGGLILPMLESSGIETGFTAGSDNHQGTPGIQENTWPPGVSESLITLKGLEQLHYPGGLVGVLVTSSPGDAAGDTRARIWDGLRACRTIATTGPKVGLAVSLEKADGTHWLGSRVRGPLEGTLRVEAWLPDPSTQPAVKRDPARRTLHLEDAQIVVNGSLASRIPIAGDALDTSVKLDSLVRSLPAMVYVRLEATQQETRGEKELTRPHRVWSSPIYLTAD